MNALAAAPAWLPDVARLVVFDLRRHRGTARKRCASSVIAPGLTFFAADRTRAHVVTTSTPYPLAADAMGDNRSWGAGRQWVDRVHLPMQRGDQPLEQPQLLIVESRSVGETRTVLAARDVPVAVARPE